MGFFKIKLVWKIAIAVLIIVTVALGIRLLSGPEDTWLCRNGQWVKHGSPSAAKPTTICGQLTDNPPATTTPSSEIIVYTPLAQQIINSPLVITGKARGSWFFEGVFPIKLVDKQGKELALGQAQSIGDWMSEGLVPFRGEINYQAAATTTGKLVLQNDNPSGLPQYEKKFEIPVIISPNQIMTVKVFFNNNNLDPEVSCNKVFSVNRQIAKTTAVARAALEELLKGPSERDKEQGFFTNINSGVKIQKLTIADGTAKVDFDDRLEFQVGGSCRIAAIGAQISETLKQFSTVKEVIISINGRTEDILQP